MSKIVAPYLSSVVLRVVFKDNNNFLFDPDIIELDIGPTTYSYADNEIVRDSIGKYEFTWLAEVPGTYKRIWVGRSDNFYAESNIKEIIVLPSKRINNPA